MKNIDIDVAYEVVINDIKPAIVIKLKGDLTEADIHRLKAIFELFSEKIKEVEYVWCWQ